MTGDKRLDEDLLRDQESREDRLKRVTEELEKTAKGKKIIEEEKNDQCCG
jgi:hypothetical protein